MWQGKFYKVGLNLTTFLKYFFRIFYRMTSWDVAALTAHLGDYNIRTDFEVKHVSRRIKRLVRHRGFDFSTLVSCLYKILSKIY